MNQMPTKFKLLIVAVLAIVAGAIAFLGHSSTQFRITSTDPGQNKKINTYNVVILNYSQPISASRAKITSQPSFNFTTSTDGNKLIIRPSDPLRNALTYIVTVKNVCQTKKVTSCLNYTLTFSTDENIPLSDQSDEQQQQVVAPVDSQYKDNPITAILPVNETDFSIDYHPIGDNYSYVVITPSVPDTGLTEDEYNTTYNKYLQEGKDYLIQKGYALSGSKYKVISDQEFTALTTGGD